MPVPSSINDIFTTAGSNPPGGGETPAEGDNHIRAAYSFIAALRDILNGTSSTTAAVQSLAVSGAAAFAGAATFNGAVSMNAGVTLGNASTDALTVNSDSATWAATATTHSGVHKYSAQPGFSAYRTSSFSVGQNGTLSDVVFGTEDYDNGGCYNAATGVFTAPTAGRYLVSFAICPDFDTLSSAATTFTAAMLKNGSSLSGRATLKSIKTVAGLTQQVGPALCYSGHLVLAASDTLKWQACYSDSSSSQCAATPAIFSVDLTG